VRGPRPRVLIMGAPVGILFGAGLRGPEVLPSSILLALSSGALRGNYVSLPVWSGDSGPLLPPLRCATCLCRLTRAIDTIYMYA